jgi:hypothetical protein
MMTWMTSSQMSIWRDDQVLMICNNVLCTRASDLRAQQSLCVCVRVCVCVCVRSLMTHCAQTTPCALAKAGPPLYSATHCTSKALLFPECNTHRHHRCYLRPGATIAFKPAKVAAVLRLQQTSSKKSVLNLSCAS